MGQALYINGSHTKFWMPWIQTPDSVCASFGSVINSPAPNPYQVTKSHIYNIYIMYIHIHNTYILHIQFVTTWSNSLKMIHRRQYPGWNKTCICHQAARSFESSKSGYLVTYILPTPHPAFMSWQLFLSEPPSPIQAYLFPRVTGLDFGGKKGPAEGTGHSQPLSLTPAQICDVLGPVCHSWCEKAVIQSFVPPNPLVFL